MLRSGTDLQSRAPPQWLAWLHRGWLTFIMWHARRSVLLGQAWTMTVGSRYVVATQPRNHMHGLSSGRYNANWVRRTCSLETAAKWFLLCLCGTQFHLSCFTTFIYSVCVSSLVPKIQIIRPVTKVILTEWKTRGYPTVLQPKMFSLASEESSDLEILECWHNVPYLVPFYFCYGYYYYYYYYYCYYYTVLCL
jgi:hypothetical protein